MSRTPRRKPHTIVVATMGFALELIFALLLCFLAPVKAFDSVDVEVSIRSKMGAGETLMVHCRTDFQGRGVPIIDLGEHSLGDGERYSFTLAQPLPAKLDRQIYHCTFRAAGYPTAVVGVYWGGYFPHWKCECAQGKCPLWTVTPKGFFCGAAMIRSWSQG